jgi:hypothetical protein
VKNSARTQQYISFKIHKYIKWILMTLHTIFEVSFISSVPDDRSKNEADDKHIYFKIYIKFNTFNSIIIYNYQ